MTRLPLPTFALLLLTACTPLPVHADVLPDPANLPLDPARPGWRPTFSGGYQPPGRDPRAAGDRGADAAPGAGAPAFWGPFGLWNGTTAGPVPQAMGTQVVSCGPPPAPAAVPGPAGVLAVAGMFKISRTLRRRIR